MEMGGRGVSMSIKGHMRDPCSDDYVLCLDFINNNDDIVL